MCFVAHTSIWNEKNWESADLAIDKSEERESSHLLHAPDVCS